MLKDVCCYYGEYRRIELHIIEFRINNEVVAYREFYDFFKVKVDDAPKAGFYVYINLQPISLC